MPPAPAVYRLPRTMREYANESDAAIQDLIYDSVTAATLDPTNAVTDFSGYDAVLVVHAGAGEESDVLGDSGGDGWPLSLLSGESIRSRATGLELPQPLSGGLPIGEAILMPQ